jgi:hypothetical protein
MPQPTTSKPTTFPPLQQKSKQLIGYRWQDGYVSPFVATSPQLMRSLIKGLREIYERKSRSVRGCEVGEGEWYGWKGVLDLGSGMGDVVIGMWEASKEAKKVHAYDNDNGTVGINIKDENDSIIRCLLSGILTGPFLGIELDLQLVLQSREFAQRLIMSQRLSGMKLEEVNSEVNEGGSAVLFLKGDIVTGEVLVDDQVLMNRWFGKLVQDYQQEQQQDDHFVQLDSSSSSKLSSGSSSSTKPNIASTSSSSSTTSNSLDRSLKQQPPSTTQRTPNNLPLAFLASQTDLITLYLLPTAISKILPFLQSLLDSGKTVVSFKWPLEYSGKGLTEYLDLELDMEMGNGMSDGGEDENRVQGGGKVRIYTLEAKMRNLQLRKGKEEEEWKRQREEVRRRMREAEKIRRGWVEKEEDSVEDEKDEEVGVEDLGGLF